MNRITKIQISEELGTDVSSRARAATLRVQVQKIIAGGSDYPARIVFDFSDVRTISESFADELFAVLIQQNGDEWFRTHIGFASLSAPIRQVILDAIEERIGNRRTNLPA